MKTRILLLAGLGTVCSMLFLAFAEPEANQQSQQIALCYTPTGCVFRTLMGEEFFPETYPATQLSASYAEATKRALNWMVTAQQQDGGWGAGSHARQNIIDPHAVSTDPATTAMVVMSLLRTGNTFTTGAYRQQLVRGVNYLLNAVESSQPNSYTITTLQGTQIQAKLGQNIDVVLTAQCLTNLLDYANHDQILRRRIKQNLEICVKKIERAVDQDGSIRGSGWAGVLQSSFASNALEAAQAKGASVDAEVLERSREFQKKNYDAKTGAINSDKGAGVMLYSVSGSTRASAMEARKAKEAIDAARRSGRLAESAPVTTDNLRQIGFSDDEALRYSTAYEVFESAKVRAQEDEVLTGFGNNGGEEFLSFLQTGESLVIGKDPSWSNWFTTTSNRLVQIQNQDGSWNGHHCITSPVFCTATCLLILSIENDINRLISLGAN